MKHCKAFIFPSFFEGFGIPPLEALSVGAKVIAANTSCLPEILQDSCYYINPYDTDINLDELLKTTIQNPDSILAKYRFKNFATLLLNFLSNTK